MGGCRCAAVIFFAGFQVHVDGVKKAITIIIDGTNFQFQISKNFYHRIVIAILFCCDCSCCSFTKVMPHTQLPYIRALGR